MLHIHLEENSNVMKAFQARPQPGTSNPYKALKNYCMKFFGKKVKFVELPYYDAGYGVEVWAGNDYLGSESRPLLRSAKEEASKQAIRRLDYDLIKKWCVEMEEPGEMCDDSLCSVCTEKKQEQEKIKEKKKKWWPFK